jgi:hypothetical protein
MGVYNNSDLAYNSLMMIEKGNKMIDVKVGDTIRAYDFKPMAGRNDCYVEGIVEQVKNTEQYFNAYKIVCTKDVFDGKSRKGVRSSRIAKTVFVPHEVSFMEYAGRVINLSR